MLEKCNISLQCNAIQVNKSWTYNPQATHIFLSYFWNYHNILIWWSNSNELTVQYSSIKLHKLISINKMFMPKRKILPPSMFLMIFFATIIIFFFILHSYFCHSFSFSCYTRNKNVYCNVFSNYFLLITVIRIWFSLISTEKVWKEN